LTDHLASTEDGEVGTEWEQAGPETTEPDWSEAFVPFEPEKAARLQLYVEQVAGMLDSRFLNEPVSINLKGQTAPGRMQTDLAYVGEDLLRAFLTYFRPLYLNELGGFRRTRAMLRRHALAKGTPDSERVRIVLDNIGRAENEARKHGMPFTIREVDPDAAGIDIRAEEIVDAFIYGRYFKLDPDKAAKLRGLRHEQLYRFVFMNTVARLADVYAHLSTVAGMILEEPELLRP